MSITIATYYRPRAVFLDRDNTLIENSGYLGEPAGVKLLPGVANALAELRSLQYRIVVVSNQAGVARGFYDEAAVKTVNQEMCRQIAAEHPNAIVDACYFCPFHPQAPIERYRKAHPWRKPSPGMLLQAAEDLVLDLTGSWMIGDQISDVAAGTAAGCKTILLKNPLIVPANEPPTFGTTEPDFIVRNLTEALHVIAT